METERAGPGSTKSWEVRDGFWGRKNVGSCSTSRSTATRPAPGAGRLGQRGGWDLAVPAQLLLSGRSKWIKKPPRPEKGKVGGGEHGVEGNG